MTKVVYKTTAQVKKFFSTHFLINNTKLKSPTYTTNTTGCNYYYNLCDEEIHKKTCFKHFIYFILSTFNGGGQVDANGVNELTTKKRILTTLLQPLTPDLTLDPWFDHCLILVLFAPWPIPSELKIEFQNLTLIRFLENPMATTPFNECERFLNFLNHQLFHLWHETSFFFNQNPTLHNNHTHHRIPLILGNDLHEIIPKFLLRGGDVEDKPTLAILLKNGINFDWMQQHIYFQEIGRLLLGTTRIRSDLLYQIYNHLLHPTIPYIPNFFHNMSFEDIHKYLDFERHSFDFGTLLPYQSTYSLRTKNFYFSISLHSANVQVLAKQLPLTQSRQIFRVNSIIDRSNDLFHRQTRPGVVIGNLNLDDTPITTVSSFMFNIKTDNRADSHTLAISNYSKHTINNACIWYQQYGLFGSVKIQEFGLVTSNDDLPDYDDEMVMKIFYTLENTSSEQLLFHYRNLTENRDKIRSTIMLIGPKPHLGVRVSASVIYIDPQSRVEFIMIMSASSKGYDQETKAANNIVLNVVQGKGDVESSLVLSARFWSNCHFTFQLIENDGLFLVNDGAYLIKNNDGGSVFNYLFNTYTRVSTSPSFSIYKLATPYVGSGSGDDSKIFNYESNNIFFLFLLFYFVLLSLVARSVWMWQQKRLASAVMQVQQ